MFALFETLERFFDTFLIPLSFLPDSIHIYVVFVFDFFCMFFIGRVLKWIWDFLPFL